MFEEERGTNPLPANLDIGFFSFDSSASDIASQGSAGFVVMELETTFRRLVSAPLFRRARAGRRERGTLVPSSVDSILAVYKRVSNERFNTDTNGQGLKQLSRAVIVEACIITSVVHLGYVCGT